MQGRISTRQSAKRRGCEQADAFPGYDRLYANLHIQEIACWVHARRKYVEVTQLMSEPGRAHEALRFIKEPYRIEQQIRPLSDAERYTERRTRSIPIIAAFRAWLDIQVHAVLPNSALGTAVLYTLKSWDALCRYTDAGYREPDNK